MQQVRLYTFDIPDEIDLGKSVAIDTETMGLNHNRDRLCLVQISAGDGYCSLVHFPEPTFSKSKNLKKMFEDDSVEKIFHYGRFDLAVLMKSFNINISNVYCTKIASKLVRTYTNGHSLRALCKELLDIDLNKTSQTSDWGASTLSLDQINYACFDVLYLHNLKKKLDALLAREGRSDLAKACFEFLPYRAKLDLLASEEFDIFAHSSIKN
ncbi:MAG: ribonuclease H-like domain-containing protein [Holosporales bacterium]|jgi:ribonuclease D|nr:ribonuclease H-like domain-containing protein [Holosporales bacterium]